MLYLSCAFHKAIANLQVLNSLHECTRKLLIYACMQIVVKILTEKQVLRKYFGLLKYACMQVSLIILKLSLASN